MYTPPLEVLLFLNKSEISTPEFIMNVDFFSLVYAYNMQTLKPFVQILFIFIL